MPSLLRDILDELSPSEQDRKDGGEERVAARNAIIASAVALCPLTAIFVLLGLIVDSKIAAMPDFLFTACIAYPVVALVGIVIGMMAHANEHYTVTLLAVVALPVLNVGAILGGFVWWALV